MQNPANIAIFCISNITKLNQQIYVHYIKSNINTKTYPVSYGFWVLLGNFESANEKEADSARKQMLNQPQKDSHHHHQIRQTRPAPKHTFIIYVYAGKERYQF